MSNPPGTAVALTMMAIATLVTIAPNTRADDHLPPAALAAQVRRLLSDGQ